MEGPNSKLVIETTNSQTSYSPGGKLQGKIIYNLDSASKNLDLQLGWVVSGQGEADIMCHCLKTFDLNSKSGSLPFELSIPIGPCSYAGHLFSIQWILEARIQNKNILTQLPITVSFQTITFHIKISKFNFYFYFSLNHHLSEIKLKVTPPYIYW